MWLAIILSTLFFNAAFFFPDYVGAAILLFPLPLLWWLSPFDMLASSYAKATEDGSLALPTTPRLRRAGRVSGIKPARPECLAEHDAHGHEGAQ